MSNILFLALKSLKGTMWISNMEDKNSETILRSLLKKVSKEFLKDKVKLKKVKLIRMMRQRRKMKTLNKLKELKP